MSNIISWGLNRLSQKFKLMVEVPKYQLYTLVVGINLCLSQCEFIVLCAYQPVMVMNLSIFHGKTGIGNIMAQ